MNTQKTTILIYYNAAFLVLSSVVLLLLSSFSFDLTNISLILAGLIFGGIGVLMSQRMRIGFLAGLGFATILVFYFGWLSIMNGNYFVDILLDGELQLKPFHAAHQQISTLIISVTAWILSIISSMTQFIRAYAIGDELDNEKVTNE